MQNNSPSRELLSGFSSIIAGEESVKASSKTPVNPTHWAGLAREVMKSDQVYRESRFELQVKSTNTKIDQLLSQL